MRISSQQQFDRYTGDIRRAQLRYFQAQNEITSGKRQDLLKNDPAAALTVVRTSSLKSATAQYTQNLRAAKDYIGNSETALQDTHDVMKKAYELALRGANSATDQSARDAMAAEVEQLQKRLAELGNARGASGQYLFAGHDNDTPPFTQTPPTLTFGGDTNAVRVEIGPNTTMTVNAQASTEFTQAYGRLEALKNSLRGGNISALSGQDVPALQASMTSFRATIGETGSRMALVKDYETQNQRRIDEFTTRIADAEEVDMTEALVRYQQAETAYTAAMQVAGQGFKLSLMDFIR